MIDLERDTIVIPVNQIPQMRIGSAVQRKIHRKLLFTTFGGIGDHICAEPTIRYAAKCRAEYDEIALATSIPELYKHIPMNQVFTESYDRSQWVVLKTYPDEKGLSQEFLSHGIMNCVDFSSVHAIRMQLPTPDREILLTGKHPGAKYAELCEKNTVFVHPGKHWPSKTFPKWWWDKVIATIKKGGAIPVIIGANVDGNRATVDVDTTDCIDLRNRTTLAELVWILQRAKVLLTNDSAPLHIAASADPLEYESTGNAHIGLIATCKHHDFITHFRKGRWQWREHVWNKGGIWETTGFLPNKTADVHINLAKEEELLKWLPDAEEYGVWAAIKAITWKNV